MHEMGIAQQLVKIAIDAIPEGIENPRVEILNLKIGKLASVVEHSLTFCFEIISKDTPLETAKLNIDFIPVTLRCKSCDNTWEVTGPVFKCPFCEDGDVQMLTGREIEITSLELADE
ncbi:hydrogenase maturation nickel metallochaperone HypA [Desulfobacula phenolica]|uniref:Hydrogenase maturation factor HypA n=1 Tax=Desulfobacula phenolica TaxID=90732 RepID=A0A1H2HI71_9BACT|nr:hydrogenase maturation nickel metallochaperone HypA [Desulfobacula phenolica]SDU31248.1 hydrogenase nickel incorporation protein HypA/HybF [Desulfobacula phenolica]